MCRVTIIVADRRCETGMNSRGKNFDSKEEGINWAKSVKNRLSSWCTIYEKGKLEKISLK